MITLHTSRPDEGCYEVSPGVFARPFFNDQVPAALKSGWKIDPSEVEVAESKTLSMPKKDAK